MRASLLEPDDLPLMEEVLAGTMFPADRRGVERWGSWGTLSIASQKSGAMSFDEFGKC
jgi:hypothetical protein